MNISKGTRLSSTLQEELAAYGIVRKTAEKKAPINYETANLFGIAHKGETTELKFSKDPKVLLDFKGELALVAPDIETFDMLLTKDFKRAVVGQSEETLREFVSRIVDEV